jgi:hypothetical protein
MQFKKVGYSTVVTDDIEVLKAADKVISGVDEAVQRCIVKEKSLDQVIIQVKQPVLVFRNAIDIANPRKKAKRRVRIFDAKST